MMRLIEDRCEDVMVDRVGCRNTANDCVMDTPWYPYIILF